MSSIPATYKRQSAGGISLRSLAVFGLGLVSATQVQIVGYMAIAEIVFAILTPYYIITRWRSLARAPIMPFLWLLVAWFVSAIATDIFRETELNLALKGALTPLLWGSSLISMYFLLLNDIARIRWFVLGAALSGIISIYYLKPGTVLGLEALGGGGGEHGFRVLVGVWTTCAWAAVLLLHPKYPRLALTVIIVFGFVCIIEGSRSTGAVFLLAASLLIFFRNLLTGKHEKRIAPTRWRALRLAGVIVLLGLLVSQGYRYVVLEGWLGDADRQRYLTQSQSSVGILGGRSEFAAALFAIADSPLLGHGSWAKDEGGYRSMGERALGMDASGAPATSDLLIPGHSHLWGPWVSHGFLGFAAWFYLLVYLLKFLLHQIHYTPQYLPFILLFALGALWDIFFSPVGFRPLAAAGYAFLFTLSEIRKRLARRRHGAIGV